MTASLGLVRDARTTIPAPAPEFRFAMTAIIDGAGADVPTRCRDFRSATTLPGLLAGPRCQPRLGHAIEARENKHGQKCVLRAMVGIDRLVPFVARVPVAALAAAPDCHGWDPQRHRQIGIGAGARKGYARRPRDDGDGPLRGLHDRRIHRHDAGRPVADQLDLHRDLVGMPARIFLRYRLPNEIEQTSLELEQFFGRVRAHIDRHPGFARDRVDGSTTADGADCEGGLGIGWGLQLRDVTDRAPHGVYRARQSKFLKAVPTRTSEDHLVAMASGRLVDHAGDAKTIDGDEAVDIAVIAK